MRPNRLSHKRVIHQEGPLRNVMAVIVKCDCGVEIDITGTTPRKDGTKVWCRVCGSTTIHHPNENR